MYLFYGIYVYRLIVLLEVGSSGEDEDPMCNEVISLLSCSLLSLSSLMLLVCAVESFSQIFYFTFILTLLVGKKKRGKAVGG